MLVSRITIALGQVHRDQTVGHPEKSDLERESHPQDARGINYIP